MLHRESLLAGALILALLTVAGPGAAGPTLERVRATGKLVLALDADYPPYSFVNDENRMDGFDVDVAREFARRIGARLEIVTPAWEVITAGRWDARWDICIGSMTPTRARAEVLEFPAVYYTTPASLVVHKDNTTVASAKDASGRRIGVQAATAYESYLRKDLRLEGPGAKPVDFAIDGAEIVPYDSDPAAFQDLALGDGARLDGVIAGYLAAVEQLRNGGPFRIVGGHLFEEPLAVAIDRGDPEFARLIAETFAAMRADGTMKRLSEHWLGADVTS